MLRDRWTVEEYRRYLETGKEPAGKSKSEQILRDAERQLYVEEAYAKAEREGRVMALDIAEHPDGGVSMTFAGPAFQPKKPKYGNERETEDGITFDSKHEHNVYRWLKARKERGELRWVFVHVPFRFMNGVVYWADFMTVLANGEVEAVWDAKSEITAKNKDYVIKKKTLLAEWGIEVKEVMREHSDGHGGFFSRNW